MKSSNLSFVESYRENFLYSLMNGPYFYTTLQYHNYMTHHNKVEAVIASRTASSKTIFDDSDFQKQNSVYFSLM